METFDDAMRGIYWKAKAVGYNATIFWGMLENRSAVDVAKTLINARRLSEGYSALWEMKRLNLTVEALVVENEEWHYLFEPEEIEKARKRLSDCGYKFGQQS